MNKEINKLIQHPNLQIQLVVTVVPLIFNNTNNIKMSNMHVKFGQMYEFSNHSRTILGSSKPLQLMVTATGYTWTSIALWAVFFGTTKKIVRLLYKLSNKYSNEKLFFIKVVSISRFHYKSFIKSLIFKIFFSGWFALCLHFSVAIFSKHE